MKDPELSKLYTWVEQTLGIRAAGDGLIRLRDYFIENRGPSYGEDRIAVTEDELFTIARLFTVNETYFFREENLFTLLREEIFPQLARLNRTVRFCSAATSIGCEAYSLAMLADSFSRSVEPLPYWIDAFDVSREVIEIARRGIYTENALRDDGNRWKDLLDRYLIPQGPDYRVDPSLKRHIRFFTYNVMDELFEGKREKREKYDGIFFRNALIYFSPSNRIRIINNLCGALQEGGFLFLGVSETASVSHPLLESRSSAEVFYFQRRAEPVRETAPLTAPIPMATPASAPKPVKPAPSPVSISPTAAPARTAPLHKPRPPQLAVAAQVAALIDDDGGHPAAWRVLEALKENRRSDLSGSELTAAAIYLLGIEDDRGVEAVLSRLEEYDDSAFTQFLRGEYYYLKNSAQDAETRYKESAGKNPAFWPAYYRISILAAEGNQTLYEYKLKKALESIELGKDQRYENFIGGFSPDYYRQILRKRLKTVSSLG